MCHERDIPWLEPPTWQRHHRSEIWLTECFPFWLVPAIEAPFHVFPDILFHYFGAMGFQKSAESLKKNVGFNRRGRTAWAWEREGRSGVG